MFDRHLKMINEKPQKAEAELRVGLASAIVLCKEQYKNEEDVLSKLTHYENALSGIKSYQEIVKFLTSHLLPKSNIIKASLGPYQNACKDEEKKLRTEKFIIEALEKNKKDAVESRTAESSFSEVVNKLINKVTESNPIENSTEFKQLQELRKYSDLNKELILKTKEQLVLKSAVESMNEKFNSLIEASKILTQPMLAEKLVEGDVAEKNGAKRIENLLVKLKVPADIEGILEAKMKSIENYNANNKIFLDPGLKATLDEIQENYDAVSRTIRSSLNKVLTLDYLKKISDDSHGKSELNNLKKDVKSRNKFIKKKIKKMDSLFSNLDEILKPKLKHSESRVGQFYKSALTIKKLPVQLKEDIRLILNVEGVEEHKAALFKLYIDAYMAGRTKNKLTLSTELKPWFDDFQTIFRDNSKEIGFKKKSSKKLYKEIAKKAGNDVDLRMYIINQAKNAIHSVDRRSAVNALKFIRNMGKEAIDEWNNLHGAGLALQLTEKKGENVSINVKGKERVVVRGSEEHIDTLFDEYIKLPSLKQKLDPIFEAFTAQIDNYQILNAEGIVEDAGASKNSVLSLLGEEGRSALQEGIEKGEGTEKTAREIFFRKLAAVSASSLKYRFKGEEKDDPDKYPGKPDPRKTNPEENAVTMLELLGPDGIRLYEEALAEEEKSFAFRDAVLLTSTKHNAHDVQWDKSEVLLILGPSGCGKSTAIKVAISEMNEIIEARKKLGLETTVQYPLKDKKNDNITISKDGAIGRQVSQMRQMVIQLAKKKGYPGIKDVEKYSKLDIKDKVEKAAIKAIHLNEELNKNIVLPDTFTKYLKLDGLKKNPISTYLEDPKTELVFMEVVAQKGFEDRFRNTVYRFGNGRAWSKDFSKQATTDFQMKMNDRDLPFESKAYDPGLFDSKFEGAIVAQNRARHEYLEKCKATGKVPIVITMTQDILFVRENKGKWIECDASYTNSEVRAVTARAYKDLQNKQNKGPVDFEAWYSDYQKNPEFTRPLIDVKVGERYRKVKSELVEPTVSISSANESKADEESLAHYVFRPTSSESNGFSYGLNASEEKSNQSSSSSFHVSSPQLEPDMFAIQRSIESAMIANLKQRYPNNTLDNVDLRDIVMRAYSDAEGTVNIQSESFFNDILKKELSANSFPDANSDSGNKLLYISLLAMVLPQLSYLPLIGEGENASIITAMVIKQCIASNERESNIPLSFLVKEALTNLQQKPDEIEKMLKSNEANSFRKCMASFNPVKAAHGQSEPLPKPSVETSKIKSEKNKRRSLYFQLSNEKNDFNTIHDRNIDMARSWISIAKSAIATLDKIQPRSLQEEKFLQDIRQWNAEVEPKVMRFRSRVKPIPPQAKTDDIEMHGREINPSRMSSVEGLMGVPSGSNPASSKANVTDEAELDAFFEEEASVPVARVQVGIAPKDLEKLKLDALPDDVKAILIPDIKDIHDEFDIGIRDRSPGLFSRVFNRAQVGPKMLSMVGDFYNIHSQAVKKLTVEYQQDNALMDILADRTQSVFNDQGKLLEELAPHLKSLKAPLEEMMHNIYHEVSAILWDSRIDRYQSWLGDYLGDNRLEKASQLTSPLQLRQLIFSAFNIPLYEALDNQKLGEKSAGFAGLAGQLITQQTRANDEFIQEVDNFKKLFKQYKDNPLYDSLKEVLDYAEERIRILKDDPFKNYGQDTRILSTVNAFLNKPEDEDSKLLLIEIAGTLDQNHRLKRDLHDLMLPVQSRIPKNQIPGISKASPAEIFTDTVKKVLLSYVKAASERFSGDKTARGILKELGIYKFDNTKSEPERRSMNFFKNSDLSHDLKSIIDKNISNPQARTGSYSLPDVKRHDMALASLKPVESAPEQKYASAIETDIDPIIPSSRILNIVTIYSSSKEAEFEEIVEDNPADLNRKLNKIRSTILPIDRVDILAEILPGAKNVLLEKRRELYDLNSVQDIQEFLKSNKLVSDKDLISVASHIQQSLDRNLRQVIGGKVSVPCDDYLIYADRQIQAFLAKSGVKSLIKISKGYDPVLAETFVLLCHAKGLRCDTSLLDQTVYNAQYVASHQKEIESIRSKLGSKNQQGQVLVSKVLNVNMSDELKQEITDLKKYASRSSNHSNLAPYVEMIDKIERGMNLTRDERMKVKNILEHSPKIFDDLLEKKHDARLSIDTPRQRGSSPRRGA